MMSDRLPEKIAQRVECIGVPGSGKTTISARLVEALCAAGEHPLTPRQARALFAERDFSARLARSLVPGAYEQRAARRLYFWQGSRELRRCQPLLADLFAQVEASQRKRPPEARAAERRVVPLFYAFTRDLLMLNRLMRPEERMLVDEGFAHRVVQFFASDVETPDFNAVRAYLRLLPRPRWLVYVRAPHKTCLRRVIERGLWQHFEDKNEVQIAQFLRSAEAVVDFAVEELRQQGWQVITVENDASPLEATVQTLLAQIGESRQTAADTVVPGRGGETRR